MQDRSSRCVLSAALCSTLRALCPLSRLPASRASRCYTEYVRPAPAGARFKRGTKLTERASHVTRHTHTYPQGASHRLRHTGATHFQTHGAHSRSRVSLVYDLRHLTQGSSRAHVSAPRAKDTAAHGAATTAYSSMKVGRRKSRLTAASRATTLIRTWRQPSGAQPNRRSHQQQRDYPRRA